MMPLPSGIAGSGGDFAALSSPMGGDGDEEEEEYEMDEELEPPMAPRAVVTRPGVKRYGSEGGREERGEREGGWGMGKEGGGSGGD